MVLLLMANYASYRSKIHLSQLFRFPEPPLLASKNQARLTVLEVVQDGTLSSSFLDERKNALID